MKSSDSLTAHVSKNRARKFLNTRHNTERKKKTRCSSKWQKKEVKQFTCAGVVQFKSIYSLRTIPITDDRLIKAIKFIYDAYTHIPFDTEVCENDLQMLLNAYTQPLSHHSNEPRVVHGKKASTQNLLMLLRGAKLENLKVYVLSSIFTFCYFLRKHREENDVLRDAYQRIKTGNAVISLKQIKSVIELILPKDKSNLVNLERLRSVFRKGSIAQMHELFNSQEYLLSEVSEKEEICMKFYFQCLETDCKPIAPSKECEVFYNREGEPLFIYRKKLMTEAEIQQLEEKSDAPGIEGGRRINIMEKDKPTDEKTVGGINDARRRDDEDNIEESAGVEMRIDLPTVHRNENVALPGDDSENDETIFNEEPSPEFSDLTTYETYSSLKESSNFSKIIEPQSATDFRSATATAIIPTGICPLTKADIPTGMELESKVTMVETCQRSSQSPTNMTTSMQLLLNKSLERHTDLPASTSVEDLITNFSSHEQNQMLEELRRKDVPMTVTEVRNPVIKDTKHLSRKSSRPANKISAANMPRLKLTREPSTRVQDDFTRNVRSQINCQKNGKMKYKQLDIVLVKFNDGSLWPSIILLKMKKGIKYKIASLHEKIIYNVEAETIQDFNLEDFECALEKIRNKDKKNQLQKAITVANCLSKAGKISKQKYVDKLLEERKQTNINNEVKKNKL